MSENSESLHLWHGGIADARALAHGSGRAIRIVASNASWTTLVPFEDHELEELAQASQGVALEWRYAPDFALTLTFREEGIELGTLEWSASDEPTSGPSTALLDELVVKGVLSRDAASKLAQQTRLSLGKTRALGETVAALLDLPAFKWLAPSYVRDIPLELARASFPDAEDVEPEPS